MNKDSTQAMSSGIRVAILGGYGDLGQVAAGWLLQWNHMTVRIGGRSLSKAQQCCDQLGPMAQAWQVDYGDPLAMSAFLDEVDILLNCAGPSWQVKDAAAKAALKANVHYVDAAGDELLFDLIQRDHSQYQALSLVLSAGLQPGLSSLLPTFLIDQAFSSVRTLRCYSGLRDSFTLTAADDFLQGAVNGHSEPLAAWRHGPCSHALVREDNVTLPFFAEQGVLLPYLSSENQRFARRVGLQTGEWYSFITGKHIRGAFDRAMSLSRAEGAAALRQASLLDLGASQPWVIYLFEISGVDVNGQEATKTVLFRGLGNAALSGAMAAHAVMAVAAGSVPLGCHYAAQILEPKALMENLQQWGVITTIAWFEQRIEDLLLEEEGVL